jgi:SAM-dependent methyltransferase
MDEVSELFSGRVSKNRFRDLNELIKDDFTIKDILELCNIEYFAPGNASNMNLDDNCIDFHTSYTVLEHIPENILIEIFKEGNRIIVDDGLFVHRIDYSDHFSHSDKNISPLNFLQYNDFEWNKYAGNRFMYMNRIRHDDILKIFNNVKHQIYDVEESLNSEVESALNNGMILLDKKYRDKKSEILATTGAWIVSKKTK